ncbi:MAG: hypothetical protein OJF52_003589 [Nitrospira sp.]|nr:MAG: hypothetical protein OJF52_003589 [Nitrospira sp.]
MPPQLEQYNSERSEIAQVTNFVGLLSISTKMSEARHHRD